MKDVRAVWCCHGCTVFGRHAAYVDHVARALDAPTEDRYGGLFIATNNIGALIESVTVELATINVRLCVELSDGHLLQHNCSRLFTMPEWTGLSKMDFKRAAKSGESVPVARRYCGCGEPTGFGDLRIAHLSDACNARGGSA